MSSGGVCLLENSCSFLAWKPVLSVDWPESAFPYPLLPRPLSVRLPLSPLTLHPCFVSLNLLAASGAPTPSLSYLCFYFHLDSASFIGKAPQKTCLCLSFLFPFFLEPAPVKFLCLSYIPEKLVSKAPVSLAWLGPVVLPYYSLT